VRPIFGLLDLDESCINSDEGKKERDDEESWAIRADEKTKTKHPTMNGIRNG
jgi:hypothetical protein